MEKEAFDKPEVQKVLKEKFIAWKVDENEYSKVPTGSGSFGIPMFFVLDSTGQSLGKWAGARDAKGLLPLLKPFEKSSNPEPTPVIPHPPTPTEDSTELEIKSEDGSKCILTYGTNYIWNTKKAGEFHNNGTFRFGVNNQEIKVKQFTRDLAQRKAFPAKLTTNGKLEGSDLEIIIEK